jgi:hypothetical protein
MNTQEFVVNCFGETLRFTGVWQDIEPTTEVQRALVGRQQEIAARYPEVEVWGIVDEGVPHLWLSNDFSAREHAFDMVERIGGLVWEHSGGWGVEIELWGLSDDEVDQRIAEVLCYLEDL